MAEVVSLGILVADIWGRPVNEWPQRGRLPVVDEIGMGLGGCDANTGISLARLGVAVAVMGCVGQDGFGDFVIERLRQDAIGVNGVQRTDAAGTSATLIMIDDTGERTFIHYFGADAHVDPAQLDMVTVKRSKLLHLGGVLLMPGFDGEPQAEVLAEAKAAGVTTCVDTVWDDTGRWMTAVGPLLPHTDIFVPSLAEAQQLTELERPEDVAAALLDAGVGIVALKMGPEGSYVRTADAELRVPAYQINPVDGSGAGDAFAAGFIYGYLHDWDLERTAKFGNALGALCTTAVGTTTGIRDYQQIISFLQAQEPGYWETL